MTTDLLATVVNWLVNHQELAGWLLLAFVVATVVTNGLRMAWPEYAARPTWARFLVGALDPFAGNFWRLACWALAKVGIELRAPKSDDTTPTSPTTAADVAERGAGRDG